HTRSKRDWSSDVCSSDLTVEGGFTGGCQEETGVLRGFFLLFLLIGLGQDQGLGHMLACFGVGEVEHGRDPEVIVGDVGGPSCLRSEERRVGKELWWQGGE